MAEKGRSEWRIGISITLEKETIQLLENYLLENSKENRSRYIEKLILKDLKKKKDGESNEKRNVD